MMGSSDDILARALAEHEAVRRAQALRDEKAEAQRLDDEKIHQQTAQRAPQIISNAIAAFNNVLARLANSGFARGSQNRTTISGDYIAAEHFALSDGKREYLLSVIVMPDGKVSVSDNKPAFNTVGQPDPSVEAFQSRFSDFVGGRIAAAAAEEKKRLGLR